MSTQKNVTRDILLVTIPAIVITIALIFALGTLTHKDSTDPTPPTEYQSAIDKAQNTCPFLGEGFPGDNLLAAQLYVYSGYNADALSHAGAAGPAQLMPSMMELNGVDGNGDGVIDAHQIDDAVATLAVIDCEHAEQIRMYLDEGLIEGDFLDLTIASVYAGLGTIQASGGAMLQTNQAIREDVAAVREAMAQL